MQVDHAHTRLADLALLAALPLLGWLDYRLGGEVRLTAAILVPVLLLTWRRGALAGGLSAAAALAMLGAVLLAQLRAEPVPWLAALDLGCRAAAFVVIVAIVARLRHAYRRQCVLAHRDQLTGLLNRAGLLDRLAPLLAGRAAAAGLMLFIDCDKFKQVNDRYGHRVGDELLRTVGRILAGQSRPSDLACRLGGDEFVLYLSPCDEGAARKRAHALKLALDQAMAARGWEVGFSIGAALFPPLPDSPEAMFCYADALMYRAKHAGRDRVEFGRYQAPRCARA